MDRRYQSLTPVTGVFTCFFQVSTNRLPSMDMSDIALRELGAIQETVNGFGGSEWTTPTALRGWTVEDLLRHVAEVAILQGEAYQRSLLDVSEQPSAAPVMVPTERLAAALAIASSFLA